MTKYEIYIDLLKLRLKLEEFYNTEDWSVMTNAELLVDELITEFSNHEEKQSFIQKAMKKNDNRTS